VIIVFKETAEALPTNHVSGRRETRGWRGRDHQSKRNVAQPLMGALTAKLTVVMSKILAEQEAEMALSENDKVVQDFAAYTFDPSFSVGVHFWPARPDTHDLDVLHLERGVEIGAELAVEIADQVGAFEGLLGGMLAEAFGLFGDPSMGRIGGEPGYVDATGPDVEKEKHEAIDKAGHGEDLLGEEVAAPKGGGVALDELGPGALAALGSRLDAFRAEDIADGG